MGQQEKLRKGPGEKDQHIFEGTGREKKKLKNIDKLIFKYLF